MVDGKVNIYKKNGSLLGYIRDPNIKCLSNDEYEISGIFCDSQGNLAEKIDFNPQALPYWAELQGFSNLKHMHLTNVYINKGRQPISILGLGSANH